VKFREKRYLAAKKRQKDQEYEDLIVRQRCLAFLFMFGEKLLEYILRFFLFFF
jgi:hypothetical protein